MRLKGIAAHIMVGGTDFEASRENHEVFADKHVPIAAQQLDETI